MHSHRFRIQYFNALLLEFSLNLGGMGRGERREGEREGERERRRERERGREGERETERERERVCERERYISCSLYDVSSSLRLIIDIGKYTAGLI